MGGRSERTILIHEAVTGGGISSPQVPGPLAREGAAIRRALVADFAAVPGVLVVEPVAAPPADGLPPPANVARVMTDPGEPVDFPTLLRGADLAVVVAPESDGELAWITGEVRAAGVRSLGPTVAAINLCGDKWQLYHFFERIGIPTPPCRTFMIGGEVPRIASPSGRVVIKPLIGEGACETFVLDANDPILPRPVTHRLALIQPYRPGPSLSASFLVGADGRAHLIAVGCQRIAIDAEGRVGYEGGELPIATAEIDLGPVRRAVEAVPGLFGFVGVDFIRVDPGGAVEVIEINPRVTTSIVGLARLAPPGTIARAWLDCMSDGPSPASLPDVGPRGLMGGINRTILHRVPPREPGPVGGFRPDPAFEAIRTAPPVRFQADGTILPHPRTPA